MTLDRTLGKYFGIGGRLSHSVQISRNRKNGIYTRDSEDDFWVPVRIDRDSRAGSVDVEFYFCLKVDLLP